jgi:hypothetical protein
MVTLGQGSPNIFVCGRYLDSLTTRGSYHGKDVNYFNVLYIYIYIFIYIYICLQVSICLKQPHDCVIWGSYSVAGDVMSLVEYDAK